MAKGNKKSNYKIVSKKENVVNVAELNYSEINEYIEENYAPFITDAKMIFSIWDSGIEYDYKADRKEVVNKIIEEYKNLGDYTETSLPQETIYEIQDWDLVRREIEPETDEVIGETRLKEISSDNTYNFSYRGLVDLNWKVYHDEDYDRFFYVITPHLGGDIRGNYGDAIILEGNDKDDLFYRFYEGFISGGASIYFKFKDDSEIGFDSQQDSDVFYFRVNEVFEPTGMAQKYLNDFEKFDSWEGDEFLENTIDIYSARKGVVPKMMAGGSLNDETPKAYIQILGYDEGKWFNITDYSDGQDVIDGIYDWMAELNEQFGGNREEYEVADYEGFGDDLYDQYMSSNEFDEIIEAYEKYEGSDFPADVISAYKKDSGSGNDSLSDVIDEMDNNYFGKYDNLTDFGYEMVSQEVYTPSESDVYITDTDKRIIAGEEADALVDDMSFDDLLNVAVEVKSEYEDEKSELEDKITEIEQEIKDLMELQKFSDDDDEYETISESIEEKEIELDETQNELDEIDSRYEDKAKEEAKEHYYDEIYDRLENDLEGWLSDYGYNIDNLADVSFVSVDYQKVGKELSSDYLVIDFEGDLYFFNNYAKGGRITASKRKPKYAYYIVENSTKKLVSGYSSKSEAIEQRKLLIQQYPSMRFEIYPLANLEAKTDLDVYAKKDYVELSTLDKIKKVSVDAYRYGKDKVGQAQLFLEKNDVKGKIKRGARSVWDKTKQGGNWLKTQWQEADFGDGKGKAKYFADGGGVGEDRLFESLYKKYRDKDYFFTNDRIETQIINWEKFVQEGDENAKKYTKQDIINHVEDISRNEAFQTYLKLKDAIENNDKQFLKSRIRYDQKFSKDIFENLTGEKVPSTNTEISKFLDSKDFKIEKYADGGMAQLGDVSGMLPSPLPMSTITPMAKGGSVEDNLLKELRKLQKDLNSSRLSTYTEGDNSEEEMARSRERESKLARFNEVLRLLNEMDSNKYADGGNIQYVPIQSIPQQQPVQYVPVQQMPQQPPVNSSMGNMDINSALEFVKQNPQILAMLRNGGVADEIVYLDGRINNLEELVVTMNEEDKPQMYATINKLKKEKENIIKKGNNIEEIKDKKSFFNFFNNGGVADLPKDNSKVHFTDDQNREYDGIFIGNSNIFLIDFNKSSYDFRFPIEIISWNYLDSGNDNDEHTKHEASETAEEEKYEHSKDSDAHAKHEASETAEEEKSEHEYDVYDNKRMLKNQAIEVQHHSEELNNQVEITKKVPAWVVSKMERATTDLSDITHYLDGENKMERGGNVGDVSYEIIPTPSKRFIIIEVVKLLDNKEDENIIRNFNGKPMIFDNIKSAQEFIDNMDKNYPFGKPKANAGMILLASELLKNQQPKQPQVVYYIPQPQQAENTEIIQNIPEMADGGELDYDNDMVNDFCMTNLIELANEIQAVKYVVTDRFKETDFESKKYKGRLIIVFKEPASVNVVNSITKFIEKAEDCQHIFEQSVNASGTEPNGISINLLSNKFSDREFNKGGKVYENTPQKINLSKTKKITTNLGDYNLGLITNDFVYFVNATEEDENSQTIMYNKKGELLSDNIHATNDFFQALESQDTFEFIHPDIETYRQTISK